MDFVIFDNEKQTNILTLNSQECDFDYKALNNSEYVNEDDYFKCSDLSASSEKALEELLTKINLTKSNHKNMKKKFKIKNDFSKNDFETIGFLGKGSFAHVLKARHIEKKEIYALKVVEKPLLEKEEKLYQVFVENEVLRILDHPNVIKIHGIFDDHDKIYTVLEYCSAGDFMEFITNNCNIL